MTVMMKSIIAHSFTFSAFCTLYMGYFPFRFVLDALESHPKASNVIIETIFFLMMYFFYPFSTNKPAVCVEPWQKTTEGRKLWILKS